MKSARIVFVAVKEAHINDKGVQQDAVVKVEVRQA